MHVQERGASFFGAAFVSDESPPSGNRYTGLRFQITWLYIPYIPSSETWDSAIYNDKHPIRVEKICCDIMNVEHKTGIATYDVIRRQIDRFGLSEYDIVAGVGDGGGENEGTQGVHSLFEEVDATYVRRRCAPHFAWRTFAAGTTAMGGVHSRTVALNNYLRDGVTWSRLASIAVQDPEQDGLGLFAEGSQEFANIFGSSPPRLCDERPQATLDFYRWLMNREPILRLLINCDMRMRNLTGSDAVVALQTINSNEDWSLRRVNTVLLQKSMFMFLFMRKHDYTAAGELSFEQLINKASDIVTSTECTDEVLETLGIAGTGMDLAVSHWVEVSVAHMPGLDDHQRDELLPEAMRSVTTVAMAIASHMRLTSANMIRSTWAAAGMLSKNAAKAKEYAIMFQDHIIRRPEASQTPFEREFINNDALMNELGRFADANPPELLWRGQGRYKELYIFLASRFLSAPDHVLDAEGTHALWKWIETFKRNVSFRLLNAVLRMRISPPPTYLFISALTSCPPSPPRPRKKH